MTEAEYLAVQSKTHVRDAIELLRLVMTEGPVERSLLAEARRALEKLSDELDVRAKVTSP